MEARDERRLLYLVFTGATPRRGPSAREAARAYCGDMTT